MESPNIFEEFLQHEMKDWLRAEIPPSRRVLLFDKNDSDEEQFLAHYIFLYLFEKIFLVKESRTELHTLYGVDSLRHYILNMYGGDDLDYKKITQNERYTNFIRNLHSKFDRTPNKNKHEISPAVVAAVLLLDGFSRWGVNSRTLLDTRNTTSKSFKTRYDDYILTLQKSKEDTMCPMFFSYLVEVIVAPEAIYQLAHRLTEVEESGKYRGQESSLCNKPIVQLLSHRLTCIDPTELERLNALGYIPYMHYYNDYTKQREQFLPLTIKYFDVRSHIQFAKDSTIDDFFDPTVYDRLLSKIIYTNVRASEAIDYIDEHIKIPLDVDIRKTMISNFLKKHYNTSELIIDSKDWDPKHVRYARRLLESRHSPL